MTDHYESEQWISVFSAKELGQAREIALVLEARDVPGRLERHGPQWMVFVPLRHLDAARWEVSAWKHENARPAGGERPLEALGSGWPGVAAWILALLGVAYFSTRQLLGANWYLLGSADAAAIVDGELWRTLTALTLHADAVHLIGNLVFGSFFGYYAGRYLGDGFGWLLVVLGGMLGNLANAWVQSPLHRSVGASTAVFAALGLLAAYRWRHGFDPNTPWRVRLAPLYAAIALLAFTGTSGETTDLGAHLFGFLAGLLLGLTATGFARRIRPGGQRALACACIGACVGAWWLALRT